MDDLQREMQRIEQRTRRAWFDDGLAEIGTGIAFALLGLYFLLSSALEGRAADAVLNSAFPLLFLVILFGAQRAIRLAKARYVHPRTGYVSFEQRPSQRVASAILAGAIAMVLAVLASRASALQDWLPALTGLAIAVAFLLLGRKTGMLRFPVAGLTCAVVGVVLSILRVNEDLAGAIAFGWLGFVLIAGGTTALRAYLREAPARDGRAGDSTEEA